MEAEQTYVVISPVRNEARYIEQTIQAVINQTIKPAEWIIVNDDSTDETAEIVGRYVGLYPWIKLVNKPRQTRRQDRQRGKGVIETFYFGLNRLAVQNYGFIVKLDGDVAFESEYFEFLLDKFAADPQLGIAGGGLYERVDGRNWSLRSAPDHVGGPAKMYRRTCFEAIGGLKPALGWDGFDEWQAVASGWKVQSFPELKLFHYRVMGNATGLLKSKIEQGYGAHYMGYHILYTVARGLRHMASRPYIIGGLAMIAAHLIAWMQKREQLPDPAVRHYIQRTQLRQLAGLLLGKRIYKTGVLEQKTR